MDLDMAVVGGGLAGLGAATLAARAGLRVAVYERARSLGGRARTQDKEGFLFNLGPHALYRGGEAAATLERLGVAWSGGVPGAGGSFALKAGRLHTLPVGAFSLLTTGLLSLPAKLETGRILARLPRIDPGSRDRVSVADWLRRELRHEGARETVAAFLRVATYAHDPERQSAGAALRQLQRALATGVAYLDGGWQTLVDGLGQAAVSAGAVVTTGHAVAAVERGPDGSFLLRLGAGSAVAARSLILAAPPREAAVLLEPLAPVTAEWERAAVPVRAACLDLALRRPPRPAAAFALGIDEPLYASVHTRAARLAPGGGSVLQLARYLGASAPTDPTAVEGQLEDLAERLQPGWRNELVARRFLPDLVVANALPRADQGGLSGRPGPEVPGLPGAFVAGDWVGGRGLLADATLASAEEAARLAIAHASRSRPAA